MVVFFNMSFIFIWKIAKAYAFVQMGSKGIIPLAEVWGQSP